MASNNSDREFLAKMLHFLLDKDSPQEVDEDLDRMGLDPQPLCERVRKLVSKKRDEARLSWIDAADEERHQFEAALQRRASSLRDMTRDELLQRFEELRERGTAKVHFRNAQEMTGDDLRSAIQQLEMLMEAPPEGDQM